MIKHHKPKVAIGSTHDLPHHVKHIHRSLPESGKTQSYETKKEKKKRGI